MRTAVLACGFGFGIAVMAALLGVGDVILEQAHSPALEGGGDVVISGRFGPLENARFLIASVPRRRRTSPRETVGVAPSKKASLYLLKDGRATAVAVTGGLPGADRAVGNHEIEKASGWNDTDADARMVGSGPAPVLKAMDRFHPIPDRPEFAPSWAEWLYFNGRSADGSLRFYLTFMVGPASEPGRRLAGVRLQLDRDGQTTSYAAGGSRRRSAQCWPRRLTSRSRAAMCDSKARAITIVLSLPGASGTLTLDAAPGQSLPPATITGARGWITGYTAPSVVGTDQRHADDRKSEPVVFTTPPAITITTGVSGKACGGNGARSPIGDLSFVYGRIVPPPDVADPDRVPGFLGVLGAKGALGFSTTRLARGNRRRTRRSRSR